MPGYAGDIINRLLTALNRIGRWEAGTVATFRQRLGEHSDDHRGEVFPANFLGADLRDAGLAEVDWPGACLRDADLRGASFHLGSSRNGLVGSPIACEGSRTGFYTDDYDDQDIKPAEEIRKANLRGADLRGASIEGVDFYLVDLRGAKYTIGQAAQLRHCRAILKDRSG